MGQLEKKLPKLEAKKETLEKTLYNNAPTGFDELEKITAELAVLIHEIEVGTERWMELSEIAENS